MQLAVTFALVMLALAYILRGIVRSWTAPGSGCASGCGKCSASAAEVKVGRIPLA